MKRERSVFVLRPQESAAISCDPWCRVIVPPAIEGDARRFLDRVYQAFDDEAAKPVGSGPQDLVTRGPHTPNNNNITPCAEGTLSRETTDTQSAQVASVPEDPVEQRKVLALLVGGNPFGGWDTVEVSCWIAWDGFRSSRAFECLAEAAQAYRQGGGEKQPVTLGGWECQVSGGRRFGGVFTNYTIQCEGVTFSVAERSADSTIPNVFVRFGALALLAQPLGELWDFAEDFLSCIGGTVERECVSRADFCADMPNVSIRGLLSAVVNRRYVCQARRAVMWRDGSDFTGVRVGADGADVLMRAYDKVAELRQRGDSAKWEAMVSHRWGCEPEQAGRVEFQMRGKFLRSISLPGFENGLRSVKDLIEAEGSLLTYLTFEWFRQISGHGGRKAETKHRQETARGWKRWQQAFASATNGKYVGAVRRIQRKSANAERVRRQAVGCLNKAIALNEEEEPGTLEEYVRCVVRQVYRWQQDIGGECDRVVRLDEKFREVAALGPWAKTPIGGDGSVLPRPGEGELPSSWSVWLDELRVQRSAVPF